MKTLIVLIFVIACLSSSASQAGDLVCTSYTTGSGTTVTECHGDHGRTTHCESYTSISGTVHTECR